MRQRQQRRQQPQPRRLRKQPKMRRAHAASTIPRSRLTVPGTARRRRQRNKRRLRLPVNAILRFIFSARWISLGLLSLTVYALVFIGMDEHFYLTVIPVQGTASIQPAEVVDASSLAGVHVFAADPNQAAARIAEVSGVISATVTLNWPNQVLIQIREDSPVAVWQEGGTQYWVTEHGRLIPARNQSLGLLVIESEMPTAEKASTMRQPTIRPDDNTQSDDAENSDVEASMPFIPEEVLAGAMQLRELRPNIERLYYHRSSGLSYEDGRGWRAYFGAGTDMDQKLVVYETIVAELLARGLTPAYISVSNKEKPYYAAN
ncbi:MAG TPA: FtsQ-type POTRA domain-containing protein [Anaerolineae bacterium]